MTEKRLPYPVVKLNNVVTPKSQSCMDMTAVKADYVWA